MEADMLGSAILAFQNMASLERLGFLAFGVLIGLVLGVIPGLGGLVGLSLLLPFTFNGFPYGDFHSERVKDAVYRPDWAGDDRDRQQPGARARKHHMEVDGHGHAS